MADDLPTFTVVTAADADARRFVDLDTIRSLTGIPATGTGSLDDTALGLRLDAVLASMASTCGLASAPTSPATFAREVVRATWLDISATSCRGAHLYLPWRTPVTSIAVTEDGDALVAGTDFRLTGGDILQRIGADWSAAAIVADYTAGWLADDDDNPPPADLVVLIADQLRLGYAQGAVNPMLRNEDITGMGSWTFNTVGGDAIASSGLGRPFLAGLERLCLYPPKYHV